MDPNGNNGGLPPSGGGGPSAPGGEILSKIIGGSSAVIVSISKGKWVSAGNMYSSLADEYQRLANEFGVDTVIGAILFDMATAWRNAAAEAFAGAADPVKFAYDNRIKLPIRPANVSHLDNDVEIIKAFLACITGITDSITAGVDALEALQGAALYQDVQWFNSHHRSVLQCEDYERRYYLNAITLKRKMDKLNLEKLKNLDLG